MPCGRRAGAGHRKSMHRPLRRDSRRVRIRSGPTSSGHLGGSSISRGRERSRPPRSRRAWLHALLGQAPWRATAVASGGKFAPTGGLPDSNFVEIIPRIPVRLNRTRRTRRWSPPVAPRPCLLPHWHGPRSTRCRPAGSHRFALAARTEGREPGGAPGCRMARRSMAPARASNLRAPNSIESREMSETAVRHCRLLILGSGGRPGARRPCTRLGQT